MQMEFSNNHDRYNPVTLAQQSHATVQIGSLLYSWRCRLSSDYLSVEGVVGHVAIIVVDETC
jgi:hypothetical protein